MEAVEFRASINGPFEAPGLEPWVTHGNKPKTIRFSPWTESLSSSGGHHRQGKFWVLDTA